METVVKRAKLVEDDERDHITKVDRGKKCRHQRLN